MIEQGAFSTAIEPPHSLLKVGPPSSIREAAALAHAQLAAANKAINDPFRDLQGNGGGAAKGGLGDMFATPDDLTFKVGRSAPSSPRPLGQGSSAPRARGRGRMGAAPQGTFDAACEASEMEGKPLLVNIQVPKKRKRGGPHSAGRARL